MSLRMRRKMMKPPATSGRTIPFYSNYEPNGEEFVTGFPYEDLDFNTDKTLYGKFTITDITKSPQTLLMYTPYKPSPSNFTLSGAKYGAQWAIRYGSDRELYITIDYRQAANPETGESTGYSLRVGRYFNNVDPLVNGDVIKIAWNKNGFYCNGSPVSFEPPLNEHVSYADFMNMVCSAGNRTDGQGYFGVFNNAAKNTGKNNQRIDELTLYPKLMTGSQMAELTQVSHREFIFPEYDESVYGHRALLYGVTLSEVSISEYANKPCFCFVVDSEYFPEFVRGGSPNNWVWKVTNGDSAVFKKGIGKRWYSFDGKNWTLGYEQPSAFFIGSGLWSYYHKYEDSILKNDFVIPADYDQQTQPYTALTYGVAISDESLGEYSGKRCFVFAASNRKFDTWSGIGDPKSMTWSASTESGIEEDGYVWLSLDGENWSASIHTEGGYSLSSRLASCNMIYVDTIKQ